MHLFLKLNCWFNSDCRPDVVDLLQRSGSCAQPWLCAKLERKVRPYYACSGVRKELLRIPKIVNEHRCLPHSDGDYLICRSIFFLNPEKAVPNSMVEDAQEDEAPDRNRHRGSGHPLSPATPPYMRVRIRRFSSVKLARL